MGETELTVFSIRAGRNGSIWVRAGSARYMHDGSLELALDALPIDGKLHIRATPAASAAGPPAM